MYKTVQSKEMVPINKDGKSRYVYIYVHVSVCKTFNMCQAGDHLCNIYVIKQ